MDHKFPYKWELATANFTKDKGKVFSCFAGGGGSSMGYKLAGFDVIGCNEIDTLINKLYVMNHHPQFNYLCDIRDLCVEAKNHTLPEELYNLDILDSSPPCSSFCMSGNRDKDWGKEKAFREGQKKQVLDTLFFDTIELCSYLQPKVCICENVKGIIQGKAIEYTKKIHQEFDKIGYYCEHYLVKCAEMGVPQKRPRVVFVAVKKDLIEKNNLLRQVDLFTQSFVLDMKFNEAPIPYGEFADDDDQFASLPPAYTGAWNLRLEGDTLLSDAMERNFNKRNFFDACLAYKDRICPTLTGHRESVVPFHKRSFLSYREELLAASFPLDYQFLNETQCYYVCGMCVPPVMMANVASRVYEQILSKIRS